jgi:hypothetical protein
VSTAQIVQELVERSPVRGFISTADLPGSRRAVECKMSRLAAEGEVLRVRKGLYWKGPKTRVGVPRPRPMEVALQVAGPGAGPAELSAVHALGLTTQVPATEAVAVPGRAPSPVPGVRFVSRSIERRVLGLGPLEVAVLEVLRAGPEYVESPWVRVGEVAARLVDAGEIRPVVLERQVAHEHHVALRERWADLGLAEGAMP